MQVAGAGRRVINEATADIPQDRLPCTARGGWLKMSVNGEGELVTDNVALFQAMTAEHYAAEQ